MARRMIFAAVGAFALLTLLPSASQAGEPLGQVRVDKTVVGPAPATPFQFVVSCETTSVSAMPISDGESVMVAVPEGENCAVLETVTWDAVVTYACTTGGGVDPCTDTNSFFIDPQAPATAIISITNTFQEPTTSTSTTTAPSTTTTAAAAASLTPAFTG